MIAVRREESTKALIFDLRLCAARVRQCLASFGRAAIILRTTESPERFTLTLKPREEFHGRVRQE
jgi:hypothetical protein